jgi:hypothetical protein
MKRFAVLGLILGSALIFSAGPSKLSAQVCKDDEGMVADYNKSVTDLVETVKKESLADFTKSFHQKSVASKLTFYGTMVDSLITCLQKSANNPATEKADADAAKAKIERYNKLKDQIKQDRDALKAAQTEKDAKSLIEKFSYVV